MIELLSRRIDKITLPPDAVLTPIPIDDEISSLSAILLDDEYYEFLRTGVTVLEGIPVLSASHLIPFKAKAWLDCKRECSPIISLANNCYRPILIIFHIRVMCGRTHIRYIFYLTTSTPINSAFDSDSRMVVWRQDAYYLP